MDCIPDLTKKLEHPLAQSSEENGSETLVIVRGDFDECGDPNQPGPNRTIAAILRKILTSNELYYGFAIAFFAQILAFMKYWVAHRGNGKVWDHQISWEFAAFVVSQVWWIPTLVLGGIWRYRGQGREIFFLGVATGASVSAVAVDVFVGSLTSVALPLVYLCVPCGLCGLFLGIQKYGCDTTVKAPKGPL